MKWTELNQQQRKEIITSLAEKGFSQADIAANLHTMRENIRDFSRRHKLPHLYQGAQPNNKNAFFHGHGLQTVRRLTRKVLLKAGRDLYTCERCGYNDGSELHKHHKDRDRTNNSLGNLEVLCNPCHGKEHYEERGVNLLGQFL